MGGEIEVSEKISIIGAVVCLPKQRAVKKGNCPSRMMRINGKAERVGLDMRTGDRMQDSAFRMRKRCEPCKPISTAVHCPEKSFCVAQNEANRRLHFVSVVKKMW
jgi:hypothetical protein